MSNYDNLTFTKALVSSILRDSHREWTVQGFGFLRTYFGPPELPKKYRLNLWDSKFTILNVSTIHDHPWDFKSLIVAGRFQNIKYKAFTNPYPSHTYAMIKTGIQSDLKLKEVKNVYLLQDSNERYSEGDTYSQKANEIHETKFEDGSVTLNERIGDTEQARVFWKYSTDWVDAIPRIAQQEEVRLAVEQSLDKWFK